MAPLVAHLQGWVTEGGPAVTVLAFIALLLILFNLLNLCTTCQKQSFELQHEGAKVERNSSTLVRVVKLEDAATENPAIDEIQKDELELSPVPEDVPESAQGNGEVVTAWRTHTLKSVFPADGQVANGASAGLSVTNGEGEMDGTATTRHGLHAVPMIAPHVDVESSLQSAPPAAALAVGVSQAHSEPTGSLRDLRAAQPELTASQAGQVSQEPPPGSLQLPQAHSQHTYETISDMLRGPTPTPSESSVLDVPSYQFVTQLEPYATSAPDLAGLHLQQHHPPAARTPSVEVEEIANLEDEHSHAMYARVSKRIKCPTPPPVPPPDDVEEVEEEEVEDIAPALPDRALDGDQPTPLGGP
ncbi:hypothetical protein ACEWY4_005038 [Coilia grayii]|uniref:Transmembrane protein n=1 Tax=Coilia grayii TaxID=363190 RepID=A0ABD1KHK8_9TELE